ncbi:MAG TPA: tetratricopeptide repeat protein [Bryobacteraceae bacterium]
MGFGKLKFSALPLFFGCCKSLVEKAPEIVSHLAESGGEAAAGGAAAVAATAFVAPAALAAAIFIPPVIEHVRERYRDKAKAEALLELYRESLGKALANCEGGLAGRAEVTDDDRALLKLWCEGLGVSAKTDPMWASVAEEDVPDDVIRLIGVEVRDAASYWPLLRAQLERWSDWFRYRASPAHSPLGMSVPRERLVLSSYLEGYLAVNLTSALFEEFKPELTSPGHQADFNQVLLKIVAELHEPLDPLRALESFKTADQAGNALQLLTASFRAIPFTGRRADMDALMEWLRGPEAVSFRTIVGRGGSGKTRLAFELLERLHEEWPGTWYAGFLPKQRAMEALTNGNFRRWRERRPTLVIIDYAAACSEHLAKNVIPELEEQDRWPLRFLLLERGADREQGWYATVRRAGGANAPSLFPVEPQAMNRLEAGERVGLFRDALSMIRSYESGRGGKSRPVLTLPSEAELERRLSDERMSDPLAITMAALVAFETGQTSALGLNRSELALQVADLHEIPRLERLAGDAGRKQLLWHMAAFVTLTGALTHDELRAACEREQTALEGGSSAWSVSHLMEVLSNSAIPVSERSEEGFVVEPVTPDIVGEALVLKALSSHRIDETILRAAGVKAGGTTRTLVRMVQDFDGTERGFGLGLLTGMLRRKAGELSEADFWQIHTALPDETVAMREANRDFYRSVASATAPVDAAVPGLVYLEALEWWAVSESGLGHREEALRLIQRCMEWRRRLAAQDVAFLPGLAGSLNNLANRQSAMGQREAALASIQEAVQVRRQLVADQPDAFLPNLAASLNNLSAFQSEMGQREAALVSIQEAVRHYRELAASQPDAFLPNLAGSLNNLANRQSGVGQREAALASIQEAVRIRRQLAAAQPDAFLPDLAGSLNNLSNRQSDMGQREGALASIQEAVQIRRALAASQPDAFLPSLAMSLNNLSNRQSEIGQREAALASIQEAVQICRQLASTQPDAFLPDLAMSLNNLSNRQSDMGQREAALASIQEAVQIRRQLAAVRPDAFLPNLAMSLNNLSNRQSEMGQREAALASIQEAVQIRRQLAAARPDAFLPDLAASLNNLSACQSEMGQGEAALASIQEAVQHYRRLAAVRPDAFLPNLGAALNNFALRQSEMGQRESALASIQESVQIRRQLAAAQPNAFLPDLVKSLWTWGLVLKNEEGIEKFAEGIRLITPFAQKLPQAYLPLAQAVAQAYIEACEAAGVEPDDALLGPIAELIEQQESPNPGA